MRFSPEPKNVERLAALVEDRATPLRDDADLDPLMEAIGDARYVLLGEASHGTSEFYRWRDRLTRRLVAEKGFDFVAVEGDWPDCLRLDRYAKSLPGSEQDLREVIGAFNRWPTWMWANHEVADLVEWMREHNWQLPEEERAGFFGLDVYSLWDSLDSVHRYLSEHHPDVEPIAHRARRCFDPYAGDEQEFARATMLVPDKCEAEVLDLLENLVRTRIEDHDTQSHFEAEQNALVVRNAKNYYHAMVRSGSTSWNVRDRHMMETLERLMERHGSNARCVVWEHNTHVGDARYTDMAESGMVNVGQLVREAHPDETFIVGFSTHRGSVIAGDHWDAPMRSMPVPPARAGSWEHILHEASPEDKILLLEPLRDDEDAMEERGHRAIGVVYDPDREHWGNYVPTVMPMRYDALVHIDQSRALRPYHVPVDQELASETWPFGE